MTSPSSLHSLPPELVAHILTLVATITDPEDPVAQRRRWRTLNSISLVCSEWRQVAQKLLMGDGKVRVYHSRELRPLLALTIGPGTGGGGIARHIRSLDLTLWGEPLLEELIELLKECEALEELVLEHVDQVRFQEVLKPNLRSFSARQCTFISSTPLSSSPYPAPSVYRHLRELDLRFNSFTRDSLPIHTDSLPALNHLLFQTGAQDQSTRTVRAFLQAVTPRLKSLSLDRGAWDLLYDPSEKGAPSSLNLTTLGLYWDAANLSIVGSPLLLPPPPHSAASPSPSSFSPPPYIHLSLYPSDIAPLLSTFSSLFQQTSKSDLWNWRNVEHFRFEQTFRSLDLENDIIDEDSEEEIFEEGREEEAGGRERTDPNEKLLNKFVELPTSVGIRCSVDESEERGTKERGFGTSWWRYVREVERGEVSNHGVKKGT